MLHTSKLHKFIFKQLLLLIVIIRIHKILININMLQHLLSNRLYNMFTHTQMFN